MASGSAPGESAVINPIRIRNLTEDELDADFNGRAQLQHFFATHDAGRFGWFLVDLKPNMANSPPHRTDFLFGRKKIRIHNRFFCVNSDFFSAAPQKVSFGGKSLLKKIRSPVATWGGASDATGSGKKSGGCLLFLFLLVDGAYNAGKTERRGSCGLFELEL